MMTPLDSLCPIPFHDAEPPARARVLSRLADTELFAALVEEPAGDRAELRIFDLPGGSVALACDTQDRLAGFLEGPVAYVGLPGRVLAQALEGDLAGIEVGLRAFDAAVQAADLAHGAGQPGLGLLQGDFGIGRIQLHQQLAALHAHPVIGGDGHHGTSHQRGDLHLVALHVGIVGLFEPTAEHEVPQRQSGKQQHDDHEQAAQQVAAAVGGGRGRGVLGLAHVGDLQECEESEWEAIGARSASVGWKPPPSALLRRTDDCTCCDCSRVDCAVSTSR